MMGLKGKDAILKVLLIYFKEEALKWHIKLKLSIRVEMDQFIKH